MTQGLVFFKFVSSCSSKTLFWILNLIFAHMIKAIHNSVFHNTFTKLLCLCMTPEKGFEQEEKGILKHWWALDKWFHWFSCSRSKWIKWPLNKIDIYLPVFNLIDKCSQHQQGSAVFHKLFHRYVVLKRRVLHLLVLLKGIFNLFSRFQWMLWKAIYLQ